MNATDELFGTHPKLLVRREGCTTSREAANSVDSTRLEKEVYDVIASFGNTGCISDDVRSRFNGCTPYSSVTARYAALERKHLICYTGEKRAGNSGRRQRVMVANPTP